MATLPLLDVIDRFAPGLHKRLQARIACRIDQLRTIRLRAEDAGLPMNNQRMQQIINEKEKASNDARRILGDGAI